VETDVFEERVERIGSLLSGGGKFGADAFVAVCQDGVGWEDIYYLTGFIGTSGVLAVTPPRDAVLFVDSRYVEIAGGTCRCGVEPCTWERGLSPLRAAMEYIAGKHPSQVAFGGGRMSRSAFAEIVRALPGDVGTTDVTGVLMDLRRRKSDCEVQHIRDAIDIAAGAFAAALRDARGGISERAFASRLEYLARSGGGDFANPVHVMVASGARTSMPHALPTEKKMEWGEMVVVDFGVRSCGYACDVTRMFCLGDPPNELTNLYSLVRWAQEESAALLKPGRPVREVDAAARSVMENAHLGEFFIHALGHGMGLSIHEPPSINQMSSAPLAEGDVVTLEPGFYRAGWGGMRVEDDYLVTKTGAERLTVHFSNELYIVGR
jgi:Xaa-Pro aminopeptidase